MATLNDIARAAGVSVATASRVLNPGAHGVSAQTTARVQAVAQELGFRPNRLARGLRSRWIPTIGVLIHDVTDPYFAEIARGIADAGWEKGFLTIACNTAREPHEELRYASLLCESRVAGLVFAGGGLSDEAYRTEIGRLVAEVREYGGHVVALGPREEAWPAEVPDNRGGARKAVEHLLSLGHREIAMVSGPSYLRTTREREAGFADALKGAGIEPDEGLIVSGGFTIEGGAAAMAELMTRGRQFTAALIATDTMVIGCLRTLRDRSLSVPGDLSLVGFDNIPVSEYLDPPLTTIDLHMRQIGAAAMRRLHALLTSVDTGPLVRVHDTNLVVRASSARLQR